MGVSNIMMQASAKQNVSQQKAVHYVYMLDEQGKEVEITQAMVHLVCSQLLQQCRVIKN